MVYQISVFLENRAGQFAEITGVLAENKVDLRAISIAETADYGVLRMIVDDAEKATAILMQHGYLMSMTPVLVIAVPNQPGGVATVLATLAEGNIDIEYMYSIFGHGSGKAHMIFRVADTDKMAQVLEEHGYETSDANAIGIC